MRAILIDPEKREISEVDYSGDYRHIYELIGCQSFDVVRISRSQAIFVDDVGLYAEDPRYFAWAGYAQPLAGKGLILGVNEEGDSIATTLGLNLVREMVAWPSVQLQGFAPVSGTIKNHPIARPGEDVRVIGHRPVFGPREEEPEPDPDACTHPDGHSWVFTGTAYGGDDERFCGEGRSYCEHCGADGDA